MELLYALPWGGSGQAFRLVCQRSTAATAALAIACEQRNILRVHMHRNLLSAGCTSTAASEEQRKGDFVVRLLQIAMPEVSVTWWPGNPYNCKLRRAPWEMLKLATHDLSFDLHQTPMHGSYGKLHGNRVLLGAVQQSCHRRTSLCTVCMRKIASHQDHHSCPISLHKH